MGRIGLALLIGIAASGAARASPPSGGDAVIAALEAAWNVHDARRYATLFTPDAELVTSRGAVIQGSAEIERRVGAGFATIFAAGRMHAGEMRFWPLDTGMMIGRVRWSATGVRRPDGSPAPDREIVQTEVLRQTPEGWRILSLQDTAVVATDEDASMPQSRDRGKPGAPPPAPPRRCILARANGDCLIYGKAR